MPEGARGELIAERQDRKDSVSDVFPDEAVRRRWAEATREAPEFYAALVKEVVSLAQGVRDLREPIRRHMELVPAAFFEEDEADPALMKYLLEELADKVCSDPDERERLEEIEERIKWDAERFGVRL